MTTENEGVEDGDQNTDNDIEAKIQAAIEREVSGLKKTNQSLKEEKKLLKEKYEKIHEESEQFSKILTETGLDRETVVNLLKHASQSEEAKLLAEGKVDQVIEKRVSRLKTEHSTQLSNKDKMIAELEAERNSLKQQINDNIVSSEFGKAADKCGVIPFAKEDVMLHVRQLFKLDDEGILRCYQNGEQVYGTDGSSPITPIEYLNGIKESKPHWFAQPVGGGAMGSQGREGSEPNPWAKNINNVTEQMRIMKTDPEKAKRLQKLAGIK